MTELTVLTLKVAAFFVISYPLAMALLIAFFKLRNGSRKQAVLQEVPVVVKI